MRPVRRGWAAGCFTLVIALSACSGGEAVSPPAKTIVIGVDLPLSGGEGPAGMSTLNGVRFFNQRHPTLDGFNVVLDVRDDPVTFTRDATTGVQNLKAFIADPQVLAMIGPFDSNVARAQIPISNRARLAVVSPATSSRCLTKEPFLPAALNPARTAISCTAAGLPTPAELRPAGSNNFFRLSTTDELQGPAAADYATTTLHLQRMAVISDGEAYGQAMADSFTAAFNRMGGLVVAHEDVDFSKPADPTAFLQQAKNDGAQGLYLGGTSANHSCSLHTQMASVFGAGAPAPLLGADGIALDPTCVGDAGANAVGIYATVPAVDAEQIDSAQPVITAFRRAFGRPADYGPYTVAAYDATGVVYDALDRSIRAAGGNLPARDSVIAELAAPTSYSGSTGLFRFDADGDTTLRLLSIFTPAAADPDAGWTLVKAVDYSAGLPY